MDSPVRVPLLSGSQIQNLGQPPGSCSEYGGVGGARRGDSDDGVSVYENSIDTVTDPKRRIGVSDGIALVLGLQIGSGIFSSPALVALNAGSQSAALLAWFIAGTLAWSCAACYIELSNHIPMNGGPQEFLAICFNDMYGFVAGWACIFVAKPCSAAMLALIISDYLCDAAGLPSGDFTITRKIVAICIVSTAALVNCLGNKQSNILTKTLLACKLISVGFVLIMGLSVFIFPISTTAPPPSPPTPPTTVEPSHMHTKRMDESQLQLGSFADAMLVAMWAYSGWETLSFVAGEVMNPERNIAIVINFSMAIVVSLFLLANLSYFAVLSFAGVARSPTVGLTFSQHFLGDAGAIVYTIAICLSGMGSLNVKTFTASRLTQAAADRRFLPQILKTVSNEDMNDAECHEHSTQTDIWRRSFRYLDYPVFYGDGSIPLSSLIFNTLLVAIFVFMGEFKSLVTFIGTVEYTMVFLTLMGLLRIRKRDSDTKTMIRNPLWLIVVAMTAVAFMLVSSLSRHPITGVGLVIFCAVTAVFYKLCLQQGSSSRSTDP